MDLDYKRYSLKECKFELKDSDDDKGRVKFQGFASTFGNKDSQDDIIEQGAFTKSLKKRKPELLLQHRSSKVIGTINKIKENDVGLFIEEGEIANTVDGRDTVELLRMGALKSMSIGFMPTLTEFGKNGLRRLKEVDLFEVSIVTFPANNRATVTDVKSIDAIKTIRDFEKYLRDVGFSQKQAKLYASKGFVPAEDVQRDAGLTEIADILKNNIQTFKQLNG